MLPQLENLSKVAAALASARGKFVFAGATILPLFLDSNFNGPIRPTEDADVVVAVLHYGEWARLRDVLISLGFRERSDHPVNRQILFWLDGLAVDFIPARMREFGTENRWLSLGFDLAEPDQTPDGTPILRLPVTAWLAAKIHAFEQRGIADVIMSRDLDDIVTLLIGHSGLQSDVFNAPPELRAFIQTKFRAWSVNPSVWDAMEAYAPSHRDKLNEARQSLIELPEFW